MLGIADPVVLLAYLLCIGSTLLCIVYGAINWNKGLENEPEEIDEGKKWECDEEKMEKDELGTVI